MTRPDDEFPPLDVTSTLNLGSLDETMDGPDADVAPTLTRTRVEPSEVVVVRQ